jgi:hypothetical protein
MRKWLQHQQEDAAMQGNNARLAANNPSREPRCRIHAGTYRSELGHEADDADQNQVDCNNIIE